MPRRAIKFSDVYKRQVIGKQGRIAKAIRTVVSAATAKNSKPVFVEIHKPEDDEAQN